MLESTELFCRFHGSSFGFRDLGLMIQNCEIWYCDSWNHSMDGCRPILFGLCEINIFRWMRLKRKACENEGLLFSSILVVAPIVLQVSSPVCQKWNRFVLSTYIYTACGKQVCRECCKILWPAHEALLRQSLPSFLIYGLSTTTKHDPVSLSSAWLPAATPVC